MEASKTMVPMSSNASHGSSLSDLDRGWPVLRGDRWGGPQVPLLMEGTGAETRKRTVIACTDCRVCYIPIPAVRPPHEGQAPLTLRTAITSLARLTTPCRMPAVARRSGAPATTQVRQLMVQYPALQIRVKVGASGYR